MTLTVTAHCIGRCGWTAGPGDPAAVDRAADKHTRGGHPTATCATPAAAKADQQALC